MSQSCSCQPCSMGTKILKQSMGEQRVADLALSLRGSEFSFGIDRTEEAERHLKKSNQLLVKSNRWFNKCELRN